MDVTDIEQDGEVRDDTLKAGDTLLHGQYTIEGHLNSGGFGITYTARDSLDRPVVIKECFPTSMCIRDAGEVRARSTAMQKELQGVVRHFEAEARRMSSLVHPNIVGVHQVFQDNGTAYMALDFIKGHDLQQVIEQGPGVLSPEEIKTMLLKLLHAVQYVHEHDVLHRDISPDNILLNEHGDPVLIDFGAAREVATNASRMLSALHVVKDGYSPQEFYLGNNSQAPSSDIYSLGATFYHLITGTPPPNSQHRIAALASDENDPFVPVSPLIEGYDHFFIEALNTAMEVFPKDRPQSATEWIEMIDQARRQKVMAERAARDQALDLAIRELTQATNKEIMTSPKSGAGPRGHAARRDAVAQPPSAFASHGERRSRAGSRNRGPKVEDDLILSDEVSSRRGSRLLRAVLSPVWRLMERNRPQDY